MSNVAISDANSATRKIDTFQRTDGPDTVETQAVAVVNPATGTAIDFATQTTAASSLAALQNLDADIGAAADAVATTDTGTFSLIALFKRSLGYLASQSSTVKQKNAASATTDYGQVMLAQRRDTDTAETTGDGQYTPLKQDEAGRLKVSTQPGSIPATVQSITASAQSVFINVERASNITISMVATSLVGHNATFEYSNNSTNGTDGTWYGVQVVRSNANTVETTTGVLTSTPVYGWEASVNAYKWFRVRTTAHTSGTAAYTLLPGSYATEPIPAIQVTGTQPVSGTVTATVTAGTVNPVVPATPYILNSLATTNGALILTGTSGLQAFYATNTGAAAAFVKLYNKATAPTVGTDVPAMILPIPAAVSGVPGVCMLPIGFSGFRFALGLGIAITGAVADADTTAVAAGQVKVILSRTV